MTYESLSWGKPRLGRAPGFSLPPTSDLLGGTNYSLGAPKLGGGALAGTEERRNSIWDSALSTKDQQGWLTPMLSAAQTGLGAYFGMKNYGLAKKQFAAAQDQFAKEYEAQRSLTNSQLADRQAARVASNPGAYQSVGDYMGQYAIKPLKG